MLKGDVGNRAKLREEIKNAAAQIRPPRGSMQFDRYQQAVTSIYFTRVEKGATGWSTGSSIS